ncbi:glutamate--tRNA ligase [Hyphomicrobium sp.]|mgnify:FL=1|uniref:glutamate--tRNA ligase n=1 Tax=Hyphomicrobium sp. TaxID=82 RepID=UPI002C219AE4|nr:glutamate--tRNA ligase [Hyphomicrobium sp.]HRN87315.1 glutamate--tRNA ligase [Hyphomicrobium sp.]HRQ26443.1 glutamate--tRNA ligase [Hyphomicrobium sp.]
MNPTVRFAPSPTGTLHIGNIRTAVLNALLARKAGGTFMLRLDDTDRERSTEEFADAIRTDLRWLGLDWTREERQSDRLGRYAEVAETLKASGHLYPCYETEAELDLKRKRQRARSLPPIYDRTGLRLSAEDRARFEAEGRRPHWRFRLPNSGAESGLSPLPTIVSWNDMIRGDQTVDIGSLSDPVLIREDGTPLYTFTSVVDDVDFGITHIVRGEDHVTNSGVQIAIFEALGTEPPAFGHHGLLISADGTALSKRTGSLSISSFREAGLEPMAVLSYAALIGTSDAIEPHGAIDELAALFDLAKVSTTPARFDAAELRNLNAKLLHKSGFETVADRLTAFGVGGGAEFWDAVRGNVAVLEEARGWWEIATSDIEPVIENADLTSKAATLLPSEPWGADTWKTLTTAVSAATGLKGRALFHPLRLALTGRDAGPELKALLPFIGRTRAEARLKGQRG